jgi:uncharacterized membrane protein YphA (DoxX/SURF4 family)
VQDAHPPIDTSQVPSRWGLPARVAFRFCFIYLGLYCVFTQILGGILPIPGVSIPDLGALWPMNRIVPWTAIYIFRLDPPQYLPTGSGDTMHDWLMVFCLLVTATLAAAIWSGLDRKRANYVSFAKWFRVFLRFALGSQMLVYGAIKVIPAQMPYPSLAKLVEPFGNFSPMGVLWYSVGAAPAYERFAGSAEVLAGILLLLPRTAMLGALICLADSIQIFTLNMTYDVPVKLLSFHLALISLYLIGPEISRLIRFFSDQAVGPSTKPKLFSTRRANRFALAAQVILGLWILSMCFYGSWDGWHRYGDGAPKSPLYGIWNVQLLEIDGQLRPLLITDADQLRRVIFDGADRMALEHMDDTFVRLAVKIDVKNQALVLSKTDDKNWRANFHYQRAGAVPNRPNQLVLDGTMGGHKIHMQLQLFDRNQFLLINRGFHWIQEFPFNR